MSDSSAEPKLFSQSELSTFMMHHRRNLQAKLAEMEATVKTLEARIAELSDAETNPVALMILSALEKVKNHA